MQYNNTPTVVAVMVTNDDGELVTVLRKNDPGAGLLGLPAGYQMAGEDWRDCGGREFYEETGMVIDHLSLKLVSLETDEYGNNLLIAATKLPALGKARPQKDECHEVVFTHTGLSEKFWAFPRHFEAAMKYLKG